MRGEIAAGNTMGKRLDGHQCRSGSGEGDEYIRTCQKPNILGIPNILKQYN
jgi:hypothetical protein